jgi:hypothetical protein
MYHCQLIIVSKQVHKKKNTRRNTERNHVKRHLIVAVAGSEKINREKILSVPSKLFH